MSAWGRWDKRQRIFAVAATVVAVSSIAYALILKFGFFGDQAVTAIDDIGEAVAAGIASAACAWAARRATGKDRLGWPLVGFSTGPFGVGGGRWGHLQGRLHGTPAHP